MTSDEVDATPCKTVQRPVFRAAIDPPEPRAAEVCKPGAELKPQQSEQPKDEIAVGGRVRHDLLDFEARFVLEQAIENVERVADRPGDDDGVKPGERVAREVVVGDASAGSKVPRVRTGTTKRSPSAEATSPPPQCWAGGIVIWQSTRAALACIKVSARK